MSNFLPDLANWALRGGAAAAASNDNQHGDQNASSTSNNTAAATAPTALTEQEVRARRLARMEQQAQAQQQQQQQQEGVQPMDVEDDAPSTTDASLTTSSTVPQNSKSPSTTTTTTLNTKTIQEQDTTTTTTTTTSSRAASRKDPPPQQEPFVQQDLKKKRSKERTTSSTPTTPTSSSSDPNRKQHRKKELLLKKVLLVTLPEAGTGDAACVSVPVDRGTSITVQTIAEILAARLSLSPDAPELVTLPPQKPAILPYLAQCHRRASEELKVLRQSTKSLDSEIEEILEEMKRQIVSYAASSLIMPDLFDMGKDGATELAKCLVVTTDVNTSITFGVSGLTTSFYYCLCEELVSQDATTFASVLQHVVTYLCQQLSKCETVLEGGGGMTSDGGGAYVAALTSACAHKKAAACITQLPAFLLPPADDPRAAERIRPPMPAMPSSSSSSSNPQQRRFFHLMQALNGPGYLKRSGPALDRETVLGLCLRLGCPRDNPAVSSPFTSILQTMESVDRATSSQRHSLRAHQESCHQLIRALVTAGPEARTQVMTWFKDALLVNTGASAMRPDPTKVSSSATLLNLTVVLLRLCEPFLNNVMKQELIDPGFVSSPADHGGVYEMHGDHAVARLGENPTEVDEYHPKNYFIPQCFFYAARALHLSVVPLLSYHHNLLRQIGHMHWELRSQNRELHSNPEFNYLLSLQRANEVALFQEELMSEALAFCNLMARFLCRMEDVHLRRMPEHFPFDICEIIMSVSKMKSTLLQRKEFRFVFHMAVKFLSPKYADMVRNYNLRAKLGDVLYELFLPPETNDRRSVQNTISSDPLAGGKTFLLSDKEAQETLAPSLLLLYGEVEHTGYYDKMTHRANIASLLKYLWESTEHRSAFRRITQNKNSFIKFANGIMNETNTLIAVVMQKLPEIRAAQTQMANGPEWSRLTDAEREVISSRLDENEHEVKRALPLCNKTLQMLGYLNTDPEIRALFLLEEMCPRLVTMLFHALTKLVGAKGLELKVNNPEEYNFRPKEMLRDLCAIFSLFSTSSEFQMECAKSGCDPELLSKAIKTCKKLNLLTGESMHAFESLPELVATAAESVADDDELLANPPDEFLDEILSSFMRDPVLLPSGHVVDRSTIQQHLLNDSTDPFNREQMTVDDIKPATELKEKMDKWIAERRAARVVKQVQQEQIEGMEE